MYKLRRDRQKEKRQLRWRRLAKLVIFVVVALVLWQGWIRVAAIWPSQSKNQPDPYEDCLIVNGPNRSTTAEVCPD